MTKLTEVLQRFEERYPRRARGGLYALAGFDLQLRAYLADFAERLASGDDVKAAGQEFLEALSDFTRQEGPATVCVQVKRTLDASSMARAALEFVVIDEFLEEEAADLRPQVAFEVLGRFSGLASASLPSWSDIELPGDTPDRHRQQARLEALRSEGRLLAPRIDPDPWWRLIAAVHPVLDDPLAFAREALDICLGRGVEPTDADQVRERIVEAFSKRRWKGPLCPGMVVTADRLQLSPSRTQEVVVGDVPTLDHLRDGRFMERPDSVEQAIEALDRHLAERDWRQEPQVYTFWVDGRSGNGKSVLLLQLMHEIVVRRGASVIWLDDASESLLELLQAWATSPEVGAGPWFVFVDDFNAPHKRDSIQFDASARLLRAHPEIEWPVLVTCGAPEQHQELRSSGHDEAFRIGTWRLEPVDAPERDRLKTWFETRTGEAPRTGNAFEQDEGLMISMLFEMRQGDLRAFGQRFRRRLEGEDLVEALALPLALNRLYIWPPGDWLNEEQANALRRINQDRDFSILSPEARSGGYVRLTHPHLSDAIYRAIRARADDIVLARDLANAFARALDSDPAVARRILLRIAERHERLQILADSHLAEGLTAAWVPHEASEARFSPRELASVWVCWACWAARQPQVAVLLGGAPPLERARAVLTADHEYWGVLWSHLWDCQPGHAGLLADAWAWLETRCHAVNRQWSRVWEAVFEHERSAGGGRTEYLARLAVRWLAANEFELDWNYVFRPLASASSDLAPWNSALRLIDELPANRNWAYVYEMVADASSRFPPERRATTAWRAWLWITSPESRESKEWAFVWQKLLDCPQHLPEGIQITHLVQAGLEWLKGRENRDEWTFVWQKLLDCPQHLPEGIQITHLVQAGLEWLEGREDRDGWTHVWEKLVDHGEHLPKGVRVADLVKVGLAWLEGRQERDEWTHVWEKLVECPGDLPQGVQVAHLVQAGLEWLKGREDRDDWTFVWEELLECSGDLPQGVQVSDLHQLGWGWLSVEKNRSRGEWDKIYETSLRGGFREPDFLDRGIEWVISNQSQPQAYGIGLQILERLGPVSESHPLGSWARGWLGSHHSHPSWTYVWQALWRACPAVSTAELALPWIRSGPKAGAVSYVALTLAKQGSPEIVSLLSIWSSTHPEEPWAKLVRDALYKGVR